MKKTYEAVFVVINSGFSEVVMEAARKAGAAGGTTIKGRGTASKQLEEEFNITIQPEKEIVIILVPADIKDAVLKEIYENVGLESDGQGIAFSLPISDIIGIKDFDTKKKKD